MSKTPQIVRGVVTTFATQIISWVLTFAVMLYLPRYVGAAGLGKLAFATSFVAIFGVIVPLGTSNVLVRDIARDRSRTAELLLAALILRIPIALAMTVAAIVAVRLLGYPGITCSLVALMALGMIAGTVSDALASALKGQEKLPRQNFAVLVEKLLSCGVTIGLVFFRAPLWMFATTGGLASLASLVINLTAFLPLIPALRWPAKATVRYVAVAGMPFVGWILFLALYGKTDPIILSFLTNDQTVGWYAAAFRLIGTTLILPGALTTALFPTLARLYKEDLEGFQKLARRTLSLVLLCGAPIAMLCICQPDRLIALMHYPKEFAGSIPVLRIGGLGVFLYFAACVLGTTVITSDRQSQMLRASVGATLLGIPACFLGSYVTHHLWQNGAVGAITSDVLLEVYLIHTYLRMVPANTFNMESLSFIIRCLVASLPVAAVLAVTAHSPLGIWIMVPCIPLYIAMCWMLGCLDPQYLVIVRNFLKRPAKA